MFIKNIPIKEKVCSAESFHNQFIVRARDTHKYSCGGREASGDFYFLANSVVEYKPARTNLVCFYKGENMALTWKFCNRENPVVAVEGRI
jgi:hypothetical protein